jgi:hypothetical protein
LCLILLAFFVRQTALDKYMALHTNSQNARQTARSRSSYDFPKLAEFFFALLPPCFREHAVVTVQFGPRNNIHEGHDE